MDKDAIDYLNAMFQARAMVKQGLIDEDDFCKTELKMAEKYNQKVTSIYRLNDMILSPFRVTNMIQRKEKASDVRNKDNQETY